MHRCDVCAWQAAASDAYAMKSKEKDSRRPNLKMRRMIESLCEGFDELWRIEDGQRVVNVYALQAAIDRWASQGSGRRSIAQSTLARNYKGETDNFSPETAQTLSDFFRIPKAVITGDLEISSEAWGMDITVSEIRWIMLMRELNPDQRNAVYSTIRALLPPDTPSPKIPPSASPLLKPAKH
jgi:hypothetical protein